MPKLNKIFAGLALSTAVVGGAVAMGATAASADDNPFFFKKSDSRPIAKEGAANGVDDSKGGIAQDNKKGDDFFPQTFTPDITRDRNDRNHNINDRNQNNWWDTNNWWGQNFYKDDKSGHDAFGLVAKDVAFGFQEKDDRAFNWLNNNWYADQNWWDHNNNDWWNRNDREHINENKNKNVD
ncbi:hypothetical protein OHB01_04315 [Microbispora hainanensis]|jgi:hypothetical protein|uniref:Uncharacterized protein n=1 Tax=Microbispora hainanensis TaxID=568844 RepID=A0ABZ1SN32_9ACTN|nr:MULTISPECIES: hypothetical protein [Microbispora]NJP29467.1 hypothetical protein [Microbispora sp. CL1-1]TQS05124.1 hypothetical protein FLW53_35785 [Microbispora sp. SCL1-1]